jgi:type IV secretion system protein VirB11
MSTAKEYFAPGVFGLLAPLQEFLEDDSVSEILINKPQEVFVERNGTMQSLNIKSLDSLYLRRLFLLIANENKQVLSESSPLLSGSLQDGSRIQLVIPPASRSETMSIRKFKLQTISFADYQKTDFFKSAIAVDLKREGGSLNKSENLQYYYHHKNWDNFLQLAIQSKKNIIISGATSSGKTTFLNACLGEIPFEERIIILEDTYEVKVNQPNVVRLKALKEQGGISKGIMMQDLVQASLRLRPDRIIMGEIRGREIFDFVAACSTGHSGSMATIHANNPKVAFLRMAQLYKLNNVPSMKETDIFELLHEAIDIIVQLEKTSNGRRVVEVYYKNA